MIDVGKVTEYNKQYREYKDRANKLKVEIDIHKKNLDELCVQLSSELGKEVNIGNIEQIANEMQSQIEEMLKNGNEILERIKREESRITETTMDDVRTEVNKYVNDIAEENKIRVDVQPVNNTGIPQMNTMQGMGVQQMNMGVQQMNTGVPQMNMGVQQTNMGVQQTNNVAQFQGMNPPQGQQMNTGIPQMQNTQQVQNVQAMQNMRMGKMVTMSPSAINQFMTQSAEESDINDFV